VHIADVIFGPKADMRRQVLSIQLSGTKRAEASEAVSLETPDAQWRRDHMRAFDLESRKLQHGTAITA